MDFQTFNTIPNVDKSNNLVHFELQNVVKDENLKENDVSISESFVTKAMKVRQESVITIPIGTYEVEDLARYLKKRFEQIGVKFELFANKNTLKCEIVCGRAIDFSRPNSIGALLGFRNKRLEANNIHVSDLPANILKVNVVRVECDLIKGAYINNTPTHTIHEFSPRVPPGYKISEVPNKIIYFPVTARSISSLNISLVDQDSNLIDFRGETITIRIHIKKIK